MEGLLTTAPTYASPALRDFVARRIVQPLRKPRLYHGVTGTLPWAHGIYGREGLGNGRVVTELLAEHGVRRDEYRLIRVVLGKCAEALEHALDVVQEVLNAYADGGQVPRHVLILEHADILCYEPDGEATMLDAIALADRCARAGVMVVALFDRIPGELSADRASSFMRACHNKFFAQFAGSVCYAAAPTEDYRERLFRWAVATFTAHMHQAAGASRPFHCDLDANEGAAYKELCMLSTWATPAQILEWLNRSFREIIENVAQPVLDMAFLTRFNNIHHTPRGPHILGDDLQGIESRFSEACGCGPVGGFVPSRDMPFKPDAGAVTLFSAENADPEVARTALKRAREEMEQQQQQQQEDRDEFAPTSDM